MYVCMYVDMNVCMYINRYISIDYTCNSLHKVVERLAWIAVNYKPVPPKAVKIKDAGNSLSRKVENVVSEQMALKSIKCGT